MNTPRTRSVRLLVLVAVLGLVATACLGQGDGGDGGEGGQTVTVLDAFTEDTDQAGFDAVVAAWEEQTGNTVDVEHSSALEETALTRVAGNNPPDVIIHPQPGLLEDFVNRGAVQELDFLDREQLSEQLVPGLVDLGTFDDQLYGLPIKLQLKSMVWYPKQEFDEAGYQVPETWDELMQLSQQIADTGTPPWCVGIESGQATGWVATDWVEDMMLRLHGPEAYDDWISHELAFDSPEVTEAFEMVGDIWFQEGWTLGGRQNILATSFGEAANPMFEQPPGCFFHRQASFIESNFPDDADFGTDYSFFILPPIDDETAPGLIAGDTMALYSDSEAAQDFMEFWTTTEAQEIWAEQGSYLCSLSDCDPSVYPSDTYQSQQDFLTEASFVRFDASDLMPGEVGTGTFWSEAVSWVSGEQELQATLRNIDQSWPEGESGQ